MPDLEWDKDAVLNLIREYYDICEANPYWDKDLVDFLIVRGLSERDIWEHARDKMVELGVLEPDWL